jgi:glutathione S-transferase
MLKIWGRRDSFNLQKIMWCVAELDIPFERIDAGGTHGVTDTPEYLALNPNGRVPTIDDDGFILWESNAIVRYLAARHGMGTLCPDDPRQRANADRWMEWQSATMGAVMRPLIITMFRTKPDDRDGGKTRRQIEDAGRLWAMLDAELAHHEFVAGSDFSMADIPLGTYAYRWFSVTDSRPDLPHLEAWYQRLCDRPAYREHVLLPIASA